MTDRSLNRRAVYFKCLGGELILRSSITAAVQNLLHSPCAEARLKPQTCHGPCFPSNELSSRPRSWSVVLSGPNLKRKAYHVRLNQLSNASHRLPSASFSKQSVLLLIRSMDAHALKSNYGQHSPISTWDPFCELNPPPAGSGLDVSG